MDLSALLPFLAAATALVSILAAGKALLDQRPTGAARLRELSARRAALAEDLQSDLRDARATKRGAATTKRLGALAGTMARLKLLGQDNGREVRMKLAQAGWRGRHALAAWVLVRSLLPLLMAGAAALYSEAFLFHLSAAIRLFVVIGGAALGVLLPGILLHNGAVRRQQALARAFPDALDLLVICVEAGLAVEAAMGRVCEESEPGHPMGDEIGLTAAELAFLGDRRQAWDNLAERTGLPQARSLATALIQAETYGTPVGGALRVLSQESREARMAAAERKAASLPAKLTVPMIIFFLPVLFIVIVGPAAIQIARMQ